MPRFYVEYTVNGGHFMNTHDVIEADNWRDARQTWADKVSGGAMFRRLPPDALFELPGHMADWPKELVLENYKSASFTNQFVAPGHGHPGNWIMMLFRELSESIKVRLRSGPSGRYGRWS